jgi:hypothetical protein
MGRKGSHTNRQHTKRLERLWREQQLESALESSPNELTTPPTIIVQGYTYDYDKQRYFKIPPGSKPCKTPINTDIEQVIESKNNNRYHYVYSSIPTLLHNIQLNINAFKFRSPERLIRGTLFKQKPYITAFDQNSSVSRITDFSWDNKRLNACITYASGILNL